MADCNNYILFSGSSHDLLASELAQKLNRPLGKIQIESFPDGETGVEILENVRGRDVFVLQSIMKRPNHYLMELLIVIDALRRASAKSICVVIPYYGYARQDRKDIGRAPITAKLVADLLQASGTSRALTMDLHTEQIQGFFDIPVDHLYAGPVLVKAIKDLGLHKTIVVSPDVGSNKMARRFAEELETDLAIVDKRRKNAREVETSAIIGDVSGRDVVIVDDICSTGETLKIAAKTCREHGAKKIITAVTHNLLEDVNYLFDESEIEMCLMTNSIPYTGKTDNKVKVISIAKLLGQAIECILSGESISSIYNHR